MNSEKNVQEFIQQLEMIERKFMHVDEFRSIVGGKIFSAVFIKQNGEVRKMVARLGVKSALKGGELTYNPSERNNLVVFDLEKRAYRTIKFDNLLQIKYCQKEWSLFEDDREGNLFEGEK